MCIISMFLNYFQFFLIDIWKNFLFNIISLVSFSLILSDKGFRGIFEFLNFLTILICLLNLSKQYFFNIILLEHTFFDFFLGGGFISPSHSCLTCCHSFSSSVRPSLAIHLAWWESILENCYHMTLKKYIIY